MAIRISQLGAETGATSDDYFVVVDSTTGTTKKVLASAIVPDGAISRVKIAGSAIDAARLDTAAVTTIKVADSAITPAKMSAVKVFGVGGGYSPTPPAADTGEFKVQAGTSVLTTNATGDFTITLPATFPTGILTAVAIDGDDAGSAAISLIQSGVTTSAISGSSPKVSSTIRVNWIAYGW